MIQVKVFNQRDPQWANEKHGTSNSTIGATGCTICVICSVLWHAGYKDINPSKLNKLLTEKNGYASGNLVIWTKISKLFPKVKWVYRHYSYKNDLAKEWVDKGIIPIIQVSAVAIGGAPGGKHWVGFVGDHKSIDPWTGQVVNTSTWEPSGMALYDYTPTDNNYSEGETDMPNMYKGYDLSNAESMKVAVDKLVEVIDGVYLKKDEAEKLLNDAVQKAKDDSQGTIDDLNKKLGDANDLVKNMADYKLAMTKMLGLEDGEGCDAILAEINRLMDQPKPSEEQHSSPEGELPKTYNGKEVLAVVIKP